jgi:glycosyltransferase involved in cell wall biosynthesis
MEPRITFSLIVPSRNRPGQLRRFLDSIAATVSHIDAVEVILVVDEDDPATVAVGHPRLLVRHVVVPPGLTMGALNMAGYEASGGRYLMLLNDDVVAQTPGWDERILQVFGSHPDDIVLVHTNDTLMRENLCVFPIVSRTFCDLVGGICPRDYIRYRIDDHIEDIFNLLGVLGERRTVYLPDVVFQHLNSTDQPDGTPIYLAEPTTLALDIPRYEALFPERKELALKVLDYIENQARVVVTANRRRELAAIDDPFSLRVPERLRIDSRYVATPTRKPFSQRIVNCYHKGGMWGLGCAMIRQFLLLPSSIRHILSWLTAPSFPRSAWERKPGRSASCMART